MRYLRTAPLRFVIALGALVALALPVMPALGQGSTGTSATPAQGPAGTAATTAQGTTGASAQGATGTSATAGQGSAASATIKISIDSPSDGIDVQNGRRVIVGGWAIDTASTTGTTPGVDLVKVYLDGPMDSGALLGTAKYGSARTDVAGLLGNNVYTNSGFDYQWTPENVGLGQHVLFIYAHSSVSDAWAYQSVSVNGPFFLTPVPTPMPISMPPPQQQVPNQGAQQPQGAQQQGTSRQGTINGAAYQYSNGQYNGYGFNGGSSGYGMAPGVPCGSAYSGAPYGGAPYGGAPYGGAPYGGAPYGGAPYGPPPYAGGPYGQPYMGGPQYAAPLCDNSSWKWQPGAPFTGFD